MKSFILILFISAFASAQNRNKVEELFLWKLSDEMKLSVPEEKALTDILRKSSLEKTQIQEKIQMSLKALSDSSVDQKKTEKLISEHRQLLQKSHDLNMQEISAIQKRIGAQKTAQFLVLRNELTLKLKSIFTNPDKAQDKISSEKSKLAPPQVIEQK